MSSFIIFWVNTSSLKFHLINDVIVNTNKNIKNKIDRRNDSNYSDWNNIMSDWENNVLNDKEQINAIIGEENYYSGDKK